MMIEILLHVSNGLILFGFIIYFCLIFLGRNKNISDSSSFDVTKDILSEYNIINVIESKSYFTIYNIQRRVIKLATKSYYGTDLSSISLSLIESGISIVDNNKNKYIDLLRRLFSNLKILYIFPIVLLLISNSSFNINDAKVSLFFVLIFTFVSYVLLEIRSQAFYFISRKLKNIKNISKDNRVKVIEFMNKLVMCDKFIYFGEIIVVVRLVLIMFEIK